MAKGNQAKPGKTAPAKGGLTQKQRSYIYTGTFLLIVLILFIVNNTRSEPENGPYPPGYQKASLQSASSAQTAPDFTLTDINGKKISLSQFKGKVVVLDFWATWCPPCRRGIPDLVAIKKQYGDKIEIIGISVDQESATEVPGFVKDYKINYPVVYGNYEVTQKYGGIRSIPTSFVIDQEGNIVDQHVGLVPKTVFTEKIDSLL